MWIASRVVFYEKIAPTFYVTKDQIFLRKGTFKIGTTLIRFDTPLRFDRNTTQPRLQIVSREIPDVILYHKVSSAVFFINKISGNLTSLTKLANSTCHLV